MSDQLLASIIVVAIMLLIVFPVIATGLPGKLREAAAAVKTEQIDDSVNRLEEDPLKGLR